MDPQPQLIKLALFGQQAVGKTQMQLRFIRNIFEKQHTRTVGMDFENKKVSSNSVNYKIQVWDMGAASFKPTPPVYFKGTSVFIIVYDVTNRSSFVKVKEHYQEIKSSCDWDIKLILAGNKCDLQEYRQVSTQQGETLAVQLGGLLIECSAKDGVNIEQVFTTIINYNK